MSNRALSTTRRKIISQHIIAKFSKMLSSTNKSKQYQRLVSSGLNLVLQATRESISGVLEVRDCLMN